MGATLGVLGIAATVLPAAYDSTWQFDVTVDEARQLSLHLDYDQQDETSVEIRMLVSDDGGTTYRQVANVEGDVGAGTVRVRHEEAILDPTDYADPDSLVITYDVGPYTLVRLQAKRTGGTPGATLAARTSLWRQVR